MDKLIKILPTALVILITVPIVFFLHFRVFTGKSVEEISIEFRNGSTQLHGILTLPGKKGPWPALVLLHGSSRGTESAYEAHSQELVKSGYAILRYDSPGTGLSTGSTFGESFENRVAEALAAINFLESRQEIRAGAIGLWGISQGGRICHMAAASSEKVAFIISVSGPGVSIPEQDIYRVEMESSADHLARIKVPVLAIFGSDDTSVPVDPSIALYRESLHKAGNPNFSVKVFPGADHQIPVGQVSSPGYYSTMIHWLKNLELSKGGE